MRLHKVIESVKERHVEDTRETKRYKRDSKQYQGSKDVNGENGETRFGFRMEGEEMGRKGES